MLKLSLWIQNFFNLLVPRRCQICNQTHPNSICHHCKLHLPAHKNYCYQCAKKLPRIGLCGHCLKQPNYFDITIAPYLYQNQIASLIKQAKFNQDIASTKALSDLLTDYLNHYYLPERKPEMVVYVPSHLWTMRIRSFNLAQFLAEDLSKNLNLPLFHLLKKSKNRPLQSSLKRKERLTNLINAFELDLKVLKRIEKLNLKHLALVDDVMTTGATVYEIAKLIKSKTQIKQIDVWLVARAD